MARGSATVLDASEAVSGDAADWNAIYLASKVGNIDVIRVLTEAGCQDRLVQTSEPEALRTLSSLAAFHDNASFVQDLRRADDGKLHSSAAIQTRYRWYVRRRYSDIHRRDAVH